MKKITFVFGALVLMFLTTTISAQETFSHPAGVDVTVPAGWFYEMGEGSMTVTTEDETLALVFSILEGGEIDAALEEVDAMLADQFAEIALDEAETTDFNGLAAIMVTGTADGLEIVVAIVDTPSGQVMMISGFAAPETVSAKKKGIQEIFGSIKPSK